VIIITGTGNHKVIIKNQSSHALIIEMAISLVTKSIWAHDKVKKKRGQSMQCKSRAVIS
jgi:hypothetical protein